MNARRILLVGYYGKGNFGDDVLLKVSYNLLKQAMPDVDISVIVDGDAGGYVPAMLGEVKVLEPARHGHFDLIVHGGGGVYFDFATHGLRNRLIENLLRFVGFPAYLTAEKFVRSISGKPRTSATVRVGLGIGVGTYSPGSPRLRASLPILADHDALWVRDVQSIENLKRFGAVLTGEIIPGSDLAFLTHYWLEKPVAPRVPAARPRLGIILRDWAQALGGLPEAALREVFVELARDHDITGFVFDQHADPELQRLLAPYATCVWQPGTMKIDDFAERLAQQDVLLTSRAHGAICGACVGVPSVIVAIEPKLQQVAAMLANACRVVPPQQPGQWAGALQEARSIAPQAITADVERNRAASIAALATIQRWLV